MKSNIKQDLMKTYQGWFAATCAKLFWSYVIL